MESANNGMCRCCASEGTFKDVKTKYLWMGEEEIYSDMLKECFDITLFTSESGCNGGICEVCITQLRNAANFKRQVLHTEEQFKKRLQGKTLFKSDIVKMEMTNSIDDDGDSDNNFSEDFSTADYEIPIKEEIPVEMKPKKRAAKATTSKTKKPKVEDGESSTTRDDSGLKMYTAVNVSKSHSETKLPEVTNDWSVTIIKKVSQFTPETLPVQNEAITSQNETTLNDIKKDLLVECERNLAKTKTLNKNPKIRTDKALTTIKQVDNEKKELEKHLKNIRNILYFSNATPIRKYDGIGYFCSFCMYRGSDLKDLKEHTSDNHEKLIATFMKDFPLSAYVVMLDITSLQCRICDENIKTLGKLLQHLQNHGKEIYTDINNHILPITSENNTLYCAECSKSFQRFKQLQEHVSIHYRNYLCEVCNAPYVNRRRLQMHKLLHKKGDFACSYCKRIFDTNSKKNRHEVSVHEGKRRARSKCPYCNEKFMSHHMRSKHMVASHGAQPITHKCLACDKEFQTRLALTRHTRRDHLMERHHECNECEMKFFTKKELVLHMVKHTGARTYKCEVCFKAYGRKKTLREHKRIHDDDRRFKCNNCGQTFVQKCSWKKHMHSKHGLIVT